jgi:hypothetical protein
LVSRLKEKELQLKKVEEFMEKNGYKGKIKEYEIIEIEGMQPFFRVFVQKVPGGNIFIFLAEARNQGVSRTTNNFISTQFVPSKNKGEDK